MGDINACKCVGDDVYVMGYSRQLPVWFVSRTRKMALITSSEYAYLRHQRGSRTEDQRPRVEIEIDMTMLLWGVEVDVDVRGEGVRGC